MQHRVSGVAELEPGDVPRSRAGVPIELADGEPRDVDGERQLQVGRRLRRSRRRLDRDVDVARAEAANRQPLRPERAGIPVDDDVVGDDRRVGALANYWARHNVTVNALAPGSVDTSALHELEYAKMEVEDYGAVQKRDIPAHRLGTAEEVAEICAFLGSPAARYINGAAIVADGGQYQGNWSDMWDMDVP